MKRKLTIGTLILVIILFATTLAGCSIGLDSVDDIVEKNDLVAKITYYANGGWFNNQSSKILSREVYYKENSKAWEITATTGTKVSHASEEYDGWYTIKTVQIEGESYFVCDVTASEINDYKINETTVITQNNGEYVIKIADYQQLLKSANVPLLALDKPFDFKSTVLNKGDDIYLATKWVTKQFIEYVLITEDCSEITIRDSEGVETKYQSGSVVATASFDSTGKYTIPKSDRTPIKNATVLDATFVDYYVYEEDATLDNLTLLSTVGTSMACPEEGNIKVLVKFTAGNDWRVIRFAKDVASIFNAPSYKYYISRDIDCSAEGNVTLVERFSGMIRGNGHTITGIKANATNMGNGTKVALFGKMTDTTVIKDVTFANVSITCKTKPGVSVSIYLLAHSLDADATPTIENVTVSGATIDITLADSVANVINIPKVSGVYNTDNTLIAESTNATFFATYSTFSIENCKLIINEAEITTIDNTEM